MRQIFLLLILCISCGQEASRKEKVTSLELEYVSTFEIEESESGKFLVNNEPWPKATIKKRFKIESPLKRVVCTSTSHLPYFELLDAEDVLVGFPNVGYISSEVFNNKVDDGSLIDLGNGQNLNMELLVGLQPDVVIGFDAGGESNSLDKIEDLGVPVIYNSDFLEQTPLGRAEYIKFFGLLLGKEEMADSIFRAIKDEYLRVKELAANTSEKPSILSGTVYGDTWFLPGGNNWAANFFENAGGEYIWESDTTSGWLELSFESVYEQAFEADYWIGVSTFSEKSSLLSQDSRYEDFAPFKEDRVYNYNKKTGPNGGIDFFESGYSRPDLVLSDLIKILHPELLPNYETNYFQKLK